MTPAYGSRKRYSPVLLTIDDILIIVWPRSGGSDYSVWYNDADWRRDQPTGVTLAWRTVLCSVLLAHSMKWLC